MPDELTQTGTSISQITTLADNFQEINSEHPFSPEKKSQLSEMFINNHSPQGY